MPPADDDHDHDVEREKGARVRTFFEIEAETLQKRFHVIETLLPNSTRSGSSHSGEEGRFIESLLRSFLNKHLPANLRAVSGFIFRPSTKTGVKDTERVEHSADSHSTQLDIIVYDFDSYPVYERFEEFCIVPPEGVVGIISVKKRLYPAGLAGELAALRNAARLCAERGRRNPCTIFFAFSSNELDTGVLNSKIATGLQGAYDADGDGDFDSLVTEIAVMGQTCAFKIRSSHSPDRLARYVAVDCSTELHIPLQRVLQTIMSVYYDPTRGNGRSRPGFVSFRRHTFKDSPELVMIPYSRLQSYSDPRPTS